MPSSYEVNDGSVAATPYNLLRIVGGWGNVNGPGLLMFRSMIAGTTTAAIFGITFAIISASICGTAALPFIFGSSIGFALGSFRWYAASSEEALIRLGSHTSLMRLHLLGNFPRERRITQLRPGDFRREVFERSWILKSMLTASWLTASPALDDIHAREEAAIIEGYILGDGVGKPLEVDNE